MAKHAPVKKYFDGPLIGNFVEAGVDELGRPIGPDGWVDGGDTCQRIGMYHLGWILAKAWNIDLPDYPHATKADLEKCLDLLECSNGFKRHSDPDFWYSETDRMSRDQSIPVMAVMGADNMKGRLFKFFLRHLIRGLLFTTNTRRNGCTSSNHGDANRWAKPLKWYHKIIRDYHIPFLPLPPGIVTGKQ